MYAVHPGVNLLWVFCVLASEFLCGNVVKAAFREGGGPATAETNLARIERRFTEMTREVVRRTSLRSGDTLGIFIAPGNERVLIEGPVSSALKADSFNVFSTADSALPFVLSIFSSTVKLRYEDMYREGMFGTKKVRREVFTEMTSQIARGGTHEVLYSGTVHGESADTVLVDDIPSLETDSIAVTRAALPPEHGVDRFVEPFVIIGAAAVAVYLLFHVRS